MEPASSTHVVWLATTCSVVSCVPPFFLYSILECFLNHVLFIVDVIVYNATQSFYNGSDVNRTNVFLNETNIALASDIESLFKQVDGFQYQQVTSSNTTCPFPSCKTYVDPKTSNTYLFYYPDEGNFVSWLDLTWLTWLDQLNLIWFDCLCL